MWGDCATAKELQTLVPAASRQPCSSAPTAAACAAAAPLCAWAPRKPDAGVAADPSQAKLWHGGDCVTTCNTTDRGACDAYGEECMWSAKTNACAVNDGSAPAPGAPAPAAGEASEAAGDGARGAGCGGGADGPADVNCAADTTLQEATENLIEQTQPSAAPAAAADAPPAAAAPAAVKSGAASARGAAAALGALAAAAAAVLL